MKNASHIEFREQRELGQIISHTFTFLRKNAKPLFKVLLKTCSIPFVLLLVALVFYTNSTQGANFITVINTDIDFAKILISGAALLITGVIYNAMLYGSTSEYIRSYMTLLGKPDPEAVVHSIRKKTGRFIGTGFANLLIFSVISIIPFLIGVYLVSVDASIIAILLFLATFFILLFFYVRFAVIYPVAANQDKSISSIFFESSRLVKEEWWMTFFTILITGILISVIGFVFQIPVVLYTMVKAFTSFQAENPDPSQLFDGVTVALQVIGTSAGYILYVILAIAINFIYFNLNERKNQEGSLERIDRIGSDNA